MSMVWKRKKSVESVQQHMIHKGHCKIRLETEEDEEEYFEYYTFEEDKIEDEKDAIEKEEKKANPMELKKEKSMEKPRLTLEKTPFEQELKTLLRLATIETIANSKQIPDHLKHIAQEEKERKERDIGSQLVLHPESVNNGKLIAYQPTLRQLQSINDSGELVLTDGSTIGHRSMWRYYRQHMRQNENRESVIISKLAQKYQTLQLLNYKKQTRMKHWRSSQVSIRQNKEWMKLGLTAGNAVSKFRYRERNAIVINH